MAEKKRLQVPMTAIGPTADLATVGRAGNGLSVVPGEVRRWRGQAS